MKKLMRYLIFILIGILILIIAFMALSPKNMKFSASEKIEASPEVVFHLVNDFAKWDLWGPHLDLDPNVESFITDQTEGVGARWTWKGNEDVGQGSREITSSSFVDSIRTKIEFNGWDAISTGLWKFETNKKNVKVTWSFEGGDTAFPFRTFNVLMKRGFRKTYKQGLKKLKEIAELRAQENIYRGFRIMDTTIGERHYLFNRQEVKMDNIQQFYTNNLGALFMKAQNAGLTMDGMPSGLFFNLNESTTVMDMAAAIPIQSIRKVKDAQVITLPKQRGLQIDFYGDYSGTGEAHKAMDEYLKDNKLFQDPPVVEEYVTDPGEEKDPSKWLTKITYYITSNN